MKRVKRIFSPKTGIHFIAELAGCSRQILANLKPNLARRLISRQVKRYGFTELGRLYFRFRGGGLTGVISLRESHIAFHTWPEHGYVTLDVYTCNYKRKNFSRTKALFTALSRIFQPARIRVRRFYR